MKRILILFILSLALKGYAGDDLLGGVTPVTTGVGISASTRDFYGISSTSIDYAGTADQIKIYFAKTIPASSSIKVKIWEDDDADGVYSLRGQTGWIDISGLTAGTHTIDFDSNISGVQAGDIIGYCVTGVGTSFSYVSSGGTYGYKDGDNTTSSGYTSGAYTLCVEIYGTAVEYNTTPTTPTGDTDLDKNVSYSFSTGGSVNSEGHTVEYQFDWGDSTQSSWGSSTQSHTYTSVGMYDIKSRSRCATHTSVISSYSDPLTVTVEISLLGGNTPAEATGNVNSSTGGRDFFDLNSGQIAPPGLVKQANIYIPRIFSSGTMKFKCWEDEDGDGVYTVRWTSNTIDLTSLSIGTQFIEITPNKFAYEDDIIGVWFSQDAGSLCYYVESGGDDCKYKDGDNTTSSGASTLSGFDVTVQFWGARGHPLMGIGDSICAGHPAFTGPEEGGPSGDPNSQYFPYLETELGETLYYYNAGIGGNTASQVDSRIQALLDSKYPQDVYVHVGVNDIAGSVTWTSYISSINSILSKCTSAGSTMYISQILPWTNGSESQQQTVKEWNASLESWCIDNNVEMFPTYQALADHDTDDLHQSSPDYDADGVHPTIDGYEAMGIKHAYPAIPSYKRTWGSSNYPYFSNESWDYCLLSGTASISGDTDTGTLILPQNDTVDTPVKCLPSGSNTITLSTAISAGTVEIYYRTSSSNFDRNNTVIAWSLYSTPITSTDQFIQMRVKGTSVTDANIDDMTMDWANGSSSIGIIVVVGD